MFGEEKTMNHPERSLLQTWSVTTYLATGESLEHVDPSDDWGTIRSFQGNITYSTYPTLMDV